MKEIVFSELMNIVNDNEFKDQKDKIFQNLYSNEKLNKITKDFEDPEILDHFCNRVIHLMYEKDAYDQLIEQDQATYGIKPEIFKAMVENQNDIVEAKLNSIFIQKNNNLT